jgi:hypothetical protein
LSFVAIVSDSPRSRPHRHQRNRHIRIGQPQADVGFWVKPKMKFDFMIHNRCFKCKSYLNPCRVIGGWRCGWRSYGSVRVVDHGVAGVVGEEAEVGGGEAEETVYAVVYLGLDGDQTGGEVGVAALPVG